MSKQKRQPKPKVAYYVSNEDESNIVFAHSANQLSQRWEEIYREPEYDCFADQGYVPVGLLHQHGWEFECHQCYRDISSDNWDYSEDVEIFPVFEGSKAFCSQECSDKYAKLKSQRSRSLAF